MRIPIISTGRYAKAAVETLIGIKRVHSCNKDEH